MNSLNALADLWPLEERRVRNPYTALWHELFRFTGRDHSENLFKRLYTDDRYIRKFRNAINLADDMIQAWDDVNDDFTGAISMYYGSLWLGMAVAYSSLSGSVLENINPAHGISVRFEFDKSRPFLDAFLTIKNDNQDFALINKAFGGESLGQTEVRVRDVLAMIPEMKTFLLHVDVQSKAIEFKARSDSDGPENLIVKNTIESIYINTENAISVQWVRDNVAVSSYLMNAKLKEEHYDNGFFWDRNCKNDKPSRDSASELRAISLLHGGQRFFWPKIKKKVMSEYAAYLSVLFVIGHAARYFPDYWVAMQEEKTREYFLIREFLDIAQEKIPGIALNHLSQKNYIFLTT